MTTHPRERADRDASGSQTQSQASGIRPLEEAGFDTTDWIESFSNPTGYKANPKYCYEWTYVQPGRPIILNLWHPRMIEDDGRIVTRSNFRSDAAFHDDVSGKRQWEKRATRLARRRFDRLPGGEE